MKAIILAAGRGKRMRQKVPKCLTPVCGKTILQRQVETLSEFVDEIIVVTGFQHIMVEAIAQSLGCKTVWNPLDFCENIISLYFGITQMRGPFILLNGDTLISKSIIRKLIETKGNVVAIQRWKGSEALDDQLFYFDYDKEAMKIDYDGEKILRFGKDIGRWEAWGESIGVSKIESTTKLRTGIEDLIRKNHIHIWYETAFTFLIALKGITFHPIVLEGMDQFSEIDTRKDLKEAEKCWSNFNE